MNEYEYKTQTLTASGLRDAHLTEIIGNWVSNGWELFAIFPWPDPAISPRICLVMRKPK